MSSRFSPFQIWIAASFVWTTVFGIIAMGWWYGADGLDGIYEVAQVRVSAAAAAGTQGATDTTAMADRLAIIHRYRTLAYTNALGWWFIAIFPPLVSYTVGRWVSRNFRPSPIERA